MDVARSQVAALQKLLEEAKKKLAGVAALEAEAEAARREAAAQRREREAAAASLDEALAAAAAASALAEQRQALVDELSRQCAKSAGDLQAAMERLAPLQKLLESEGADDRTRQALKAQRQKLVQAALSGMAQLRSHVRVHAVPTVAPRRTRAHGMHASLV